MAPNSDVEIVGDAIAVDDASRASNPRNRKPSAKSQESQANQELYETVINGGLKAPKKTTRTAAANAATSGKSKAACPSGDDVTGWRMVLEELGNLKEMAVQQQDTIKDLREELRALKQPMEKTANEAQDIKTRVTEELKHVHERLDTIGSNPALNNYTNVSPNPTYAEVARTPPNSFPGNVVSISSMGTTPSTMTDTLYCTIDTSGVASEDTDKISAGAIRTAVENEIRTTTDQTNWRCRAVTKDARNSHRIRIACRDEAEHNTVKQAMEAKLMSGARILRDELFPIRVDNVNCTAALDETGNIWTGATEAFAKENDTQIAKIAWLSNRDVPKAYGLMVVYLNKGSDAHCLFREGFFYARGESGYTKMFKRRP